MDCLPVRESPEYAHAVSGQGGWLAERSNLLSHIQHPRAQLDALLGAVFRLPKPHVRLGFTFQEDESHLLPLMPSWPLAKLEVVDLQEAMSGRSGKRMSLQQCCQQHLGQRLDKQHQCSNWERRPLRSDQIRYAAIDAWCLLRLWEARAPVAGATPQG